MVSIYLLSGNLMAEHDSTSERTSRAPAEVDHDAAALENLHKANELVGKWALTLVLLCLVTLGLMHLSETQWRENQSLYEKIRLLESLRDAPDLQTHLAAEQKALDSALYHEIDLDALRFKLATGQYQNRAPVYEAISELKARRRNLWGISGESVNVLGINIPIGSFAYLVPLIILVLVHKVTSTVYYRQDLRSRMTGLEAWKEGPYLLGFGSAPTPREPSAKYLRAVSFLITLGFLGLPVLTSFLFIMSSYNLRRDYDRASHDLILTVNWGCLLLTLLDVVLIAYKENLLNPRSLAPAVTPRPPQATKKSGVRLLAWSLCGLPAIVFLTHYRTLGHFHVTYLLAATVMSAILPMGLAMLRVHPERPLLRGLVFAGVIIALFWLSIPPLVWSGFLRYSHADPDEIAQLSLAVGAGALVAGLIYARMNRQPS